MNQARSVVSVEYAGEDVRGAIRRALDHADWKRAVPAGADVSLKVNLGWDLFIPGSITSPMVVELLIEEIRSHVGRIFLVEADQVLEDIEKAFASSGMAEVCQRTGAQWVNMSRGPTVWVDAPENRILKRIEVPRILRDTVVITVPVMKTHAKTGLTGSLKNQWGCLSKMRHEYHLVLDEAIADINAVVRPALALMDGTIGLEGNGPKSGWPRVADRILCSRDLVALDTVQAVAMGLDPHTVRHLQTCLERGLGTNDLSQIEILESPALPPLAPFKVAQHNAVSLFENVLRRSLLKKLVFNTPLFHLPLAGAKLFYRAWALRHGAAAWSEAERHPVYGQQWQRLQRPWPIRPR